MATDVPQQTPDSLLEAGQAALAAGRWAQAHVAFETALRLTETAEALEGLGMAAWWLDDASTTFDARERAYRLYRQRNDPRGSARIATAIAYDHVSFRGEHAIASGWLQRARRLLDGIETSPEFCWLNIIDGYVALMCDHAPATTQRLCAEAVTIARALGNIDLEMLALAYEGLALVSQGAVGEGMRRLDEATLAAVAGELSDIDATCTTCCCLIYACERTRDYERAAQWCQRLKLLATRWAYPMMFSYCRMHYAGVLIWQGAWAEAEAELAESIQALEATRPAEAAEGLVRLADLRLRQGRFAEAETLFERAESPPFRMLANALCIRGRAALALARGDSLTAVELAERFLRVVPESDRMERVSGLELLVEAFVGCGYRARAETALAELETITTDIGTKPMQGASRFARGLIDAAAGNAASARQCFEDAVDLWNSSPLPLETARARIELACSLLQLGRLQIAEQQVREALATLDQLGALAEAARAMALLRKIEISAQTAAKPPDTSHLTPREVEVLRLIAASKSNQEIATQLFLSIRTVERHISNIYNKIGANGTVARATATAYAHQHDLT